MAVTTFAAIDIGSYNVSMEIFELTKKNGLRSLTRLRQPLELGRDTFALKKISMEKVDELWQELHDYDRRMWRRCRLGVIGIFTNLPTLAGEKATLGIYHIAQKLVKFN